MPVICEKPLIEILGVDDQHDRLDTAYYLPEFVEAEKFFENSPHRMITLGEVMTNDASYGVLPPSTCYCEDGIHLIRSSNVSNQGVDYASSVNVPKEWIGSERARIKRKDILISIKGARAFFDMCVVQDESPEAIVNGSLFRFQCKPKYDPNFVIAWLRSKHIQSLVFRERTNLGISYISSDTLNLIPFPEIDLIQQQLIVERFREVYSISSQIKSMKAAIATDIEKQQLIISDIFTNKLGIPTPETSSTKYRIVSPENLQDRLDWKTYDPNLISDVDKLAANFRSRKKLSDVAVLKNFYYSPSQLGSQEVKLIRVKWHGLGAELRETKLASKISGQITDAASGDVILSRIDITQGAVAVIPDKLHDGVITKEFFLLDVDKDKYSNELLIRILLHKRYNQYFLTTRTGATKRLRLDNDILLQLPIPDIDPDSQINTIREIESVERKIQKLKSLSSISDNRSDQLLELAFSDLLALVRKSRISELQKTATSWIDDLNQKAKEALQ